MRLPAASTPMSAMVTPASERAPIAASAARSTVSRFGCLPNLVIRIPMIQIWSLALICCSFVACGVGSSRGLEAEADGLCPVGVGADRERCESYLHPVVDMFRVGLDIDEVGPHLSAVAVHHGSDERDADPRCGERDDRERPHRSFGRDRDGLEFGGEAAGACIPPVEEPRTAVGAFPRDQVRFTVVKNQVV